MKKKKPKKKKMVMVMMIMMMMNNSDFQLFQVAHLRTYTVTATVDYGSL